LPLQAVLQQTPLEQFPLAQVVPVAQAAPFPLSEETHAPDEHVWPLGQAMPQAPQLLGLVDVLTQAEPHTVEPVGQLHCPDVHMPPDLQATPQAPQLLGSLVVLTHVPLQLICPPEHWEIHVPDEHVWPLGHAVPQAPQLFGSVWVLMHVPPQDTCPAAHALQTPPLQIPLWQLEPVEQEEPLGAPTQAPFTHPAPLPQAVPQAPQLDGSEVRFSQKVPQRVPGHVSVSPAAPILYSTSRFASAPVFARQVEPVRRIDCRVAPPANVITMGPVSDQ
jgi:hypothetical protein